MIKQHNNTKYNHKIRRAIVIMAFALISIPTPKIFAEKALTQNQINAVLLPQSKLWLAGDSTLHEYESTASKIDVAVDFQSNDAAGSSNVSLYDKVKNGKMSKLDVSIPVKDMKSGKNQLDKNMQKALKAEENPLIKFTLQKYQTVTDPNKNDFVIKASGILEVAGVQKAIDIDGNASATAEGIRIQGTKNLLMTDYGVKPPSMLVIKTKNEITIHFDLLIGQPAQ